ncbi:hypothetical protein IU433_15375 [Nocardia puris]|uniref:hypothetical protein n=1 Tax=Nocardia puris TaxID=208602 RepID=UPI001893E7F9|nr:hypothetical protein [Nocardia puris]MBF6214527.1 hypothetical protein [Nocardia puris]MBF6365936.1 hypothetical protein [Nocardia puris]MBF6460421.1 hypothetical protein [Nocardia puris]
MSENLSEWTRLAEQARAGELYLNDEAAARQVLVATNKRLEDLEELLRYSEDARNVTGFGDFEMADILAEKFRKQATGTDDSIDTIIERDIEVVKHQRDIMAISIARLTGQDYTNAASITSIIDSVGNES